MRPRLCLRDGADAADLGLWSLRAGGTDVRRERRNPSTTRTRIVALGDHPYSLTNTETPTAATLLDLGQSRRGPLSGVLITEFAPEPEDLLTRGRDLCRAGHPGLRRAPVSPLIESDRADTIVKSDPLVKDIDDI